MNILVADFRYDEGLRIRRDSAIPCLKATGGGGLSGKTLVVEVIDDTDKTSNRERLDRMYPRGGAKCE